MNKELPNDNTGNALQRLKDDGTDLTKMMANVLLKIAGSWS